MTEPNNSWWSNLVCRDNIPPYENAREALPPSDDRESGNAYKFRRKKVGTHLILSHLSRGKNRFVFGNWDDANVVVAHALLLCSPCWIARCWNSTTTQIVIAITTASPRPAQIGPFPTSGVGSNKNGPVAIGFKLNAPRSRHQSVECDFHLRPSSCYSLGIRRYCEARNRISTNDTSDLPRSHSHYSLLMRDGWVEWYF